MALHPYYPLDLQLPGFESATIPFEQVLAIFFGGATIVVIAVWWLTGLFKQISSTERVLSCWFILTGIIHLLIEGAVVLDADFYKDTSGNILSEIWKEYAKADSRYATRDSFVISMETVTAFVEGPACFFISYGILSQRPWRYTLMLLVSLGQLYGDVLYFGTCYLEGGIHSRPEWLYFWFYFVIINAIWIVIPAACIGYAAVQISAAVGVHDRVSKKGGKKA